MELRNCLTSLVAGGLMLLTAGCSIGSPTLRSASMRRTEVGPITSFVSGIPERGLVHRPDARRHFGYSVTPEASAENGRPRLRLARAYREPL